MRRALVLFAAILFFGSTAARATGPDQRLRDFETSAETRIRDALDRYYGESVRPVVSVRAQAVEASQEAPKDPKGDRVDLAYVPVPLVPSFWKDGEGAGGPGHEAPLQIASLEASVQVLADADQPDVPTDAVASLVKSLFPGISANVKATVVRKPVIQKKKADEPAKDEKKEPPKEIDWVRWAMLAAGALGALALAASIMAVGRSMVASAQALAQGLSEALSKREAAPPPPKPVVEAKKEEPPPASKIPPVPGMERQDIVRSVQLLRATLKSEPALLTRSFSGSERDSRGLRRLLTFLEDAELAELGKSLGQFRLDKLVELGPGELSADEFSTWLKGISEQIAVRRIQGGSEVEKALGPERLLKLSSASPDELVRIARQSGHAADWRIALELLPQSETEAAIRGATDAERDVMISAAGATPQDVAQAADRWIQALASGEGSNVVSIAGGAAAGGGAQGKARKRFLEARLSGPLLAELLAKPLGEEDAFLERMQGSMPDLVELIRSRIWTPKDLDEVPDDYLGKMVKGLDNEQRVLLVLALPETQSERIRNLTPEGNAKTILQDRIRKALAKPDPAQNLRALEFSRAFLAQLRDEAVAGRFKRTSGEQAPMEGGGAAPPSMPNAA